MLTHRGFSAWIVVDGKPLPEYLVAVDQNQHRVSCWVPSEEGKKFIVAYQDHGGNVDTCSYITLDGFMTPGRFLFGHGIATRSGVKASDSTERPFVFSKVEDTDSETDIQIAAKEVGMITLRIKRIKRVAVQPADPAEPIPTKVLGKRKAGDICVGFGEEAQVEIQRDTTWAVRPYETDDPKQTQPSTYVTFVFRYRSREFLESQGIAAEEEIHAPPITVPAPVDKKPQLRRVVSLPLDISNAAPPKKKAKLSHLLGLGLRSSDMRRTVSCKTTTTTTSRRNFPGQGVIVFQNVAEHEHHHVVVNNQSGDSSTEVGESQSSNGSDY